MILFTWSNLVKPLLTKMDPTEQDSKFIDMRKEAILVVSCFASSHSLITPFAKSTIRSELALLNDSPRAATVVAVGRLKCATLGKKAFTRLLGPVREILNRNSENYEGSK